MLYAITKTYTEVSDTHTTVGEILVTVLKRGLKKGRGQFLKESDPATMDNAMPALCAPWSTSLTPNYGLQLFVNPICVY